MRYWIFLFPMLLAAQILEVGDPVLPKQLSDQFGKTYTIGEEACWVVTWDKMTTRRANTYFAGDSSLLDQNLTRIIVDVSQTPSGILNLFVMPRMRSYSHPILFSYDAAYNRSIPYKDGYITVLSISEGKIHAIDFALDEQELEAILADH